MLYMAVNIFAQLCFRSRVGRGITAYDCVFIILVLLLLVLITPGAYYPGAYYLVKNQLIDACVKQKALNIVMGVVQGRVTIDYAGIFYYGIGQCCAVILKNSDAYHKLLC